MNPYMLIHLHYGYSIDQCDGCVCVSEPKRLIESIDLVEACGGLTEIKRHLKDGCYVSNEKVIVRKAIADYEEIYGGEHV